MRRWEFVAALGGAAMWPLAARAQPARQVVGFIDIGIAISLAFKCATVPVRSAS
jgi:hypothetical protein